MDNKVKEGNIISSAIIRTIVWLLATFGVMLAFGIVLENLEAEVNNKLMATLGSNFVIFTAAIGTPVHELGHLIAAKLSGFRIISFSLFEPFTYKKTGILGYVSFASDPASLKDLICTFFVGIAPMIMGVIAIFLILKFLLPEAYSYADKKSDDAWRSARHFKWFKSLTTFYISFLRGLFKVRGFGIVRVILALYFITSISMHMTISSVDLNNGITGFIILCAIYFIYGLITAILRVDNYLMEAVEMAGMLTMFFMVGVISDLLLLGVAQFLPG